MARATFMRRHHAGIASGAALTVAATAMIAYAITSDGYKAHEAELNDGGVWVVNGAKGWSGRMNKPINQLDGVVPSQEGKTRLDIVQDGAAVVSLNLNASRGQSIETSRLETEDGGAAALPTGGEVRMAGGTLASADPETGQVWAVRYDDQVGKPMMNVIDRQAEALAEVGEAATLAVSQGGNLVLVSRAEGTVTTIDASGDAFAEPRTQDLPGDAGQATSVTTVGERIVTLDADAGVVRTVDGAVASVPPGSVLQQAGPAYDAVLVAAPDGLLSVDLDSGEVTTVASENTETSAPIGGTPVEPVRLGACVFGAWSGGVGQVAAQCGSQDALVNDLGGNATSLALRVNRGEIVLNDGLSGTVWDIQQDRPIKIDNWDAFTSRKQDEDDDNENDNQTDADRRPPKAEPDSYGVRAGRTTVLHPLDNDSAPEGRLLSIVEVAQPPGGARVEISPDGQTLVLQMPDDGRAGSFEYYIDDGRNGLSAHATVVVEVRENDENEPPELREGYERPTYRVPFGGALAVPVLADWRDDGDGDTLLLDSATAVGGDESGAVARTTADGRIRFNAPTSGDDGQQLVRVELTVTDGRSAPVKKAISFQVQARRDQKAFPPSAEPDVVRGEVGKPIKIRPLLNDLPGSDPSTPEAELALGGKVPQQPAATVVSDLDGGQLTFTGDRAGTYFLTYDAAYGNAPLDQGTIRVDVKPRPKRIDEPIAMPDTLTVYDQAPGIVDVLANDLDPAGGLLTVQSATAERPGQVDVAIIDGRWLRISAVQPDLAPETQTVSYTISNGASSGVRGEVVVTQRPAPQDNTPITVPDRVVVRAGASGSAPVLDNDVSPSGDRLTLLNDLVAGGTPGQLEVEAPIDVSGDVGQAFVSGRLVRYVAPAEIAERDTFSIRYIAQNLDGNRAPGVLRVTVVPEDDPNDPPEPPPLEGRAVSGDTIKVRVPGFGIDRDGDPVTVTGITSAPRLGRIVDYGGNFLEYEAYPRTVGTDEFSYAVVDSQGAFATGTIRVAVVPPGEPQPPLAVEDRLTVEPGRTATFDPLANDFVGAGDTVEVALIDAPDGAELDPETNLVTVPAPDSVDAPPVVIVYRVTNGLAESRATMTLETLADHNNPPIVYDAFGRAGDSGSVVVDVLEGAYDPDGPAESLQVTAVGGGARVVDGVAVRADRAEAPQVLPFQVVDADGGTATASVYVPPTGNGLPYVLDDAQITMDVDSETTGKISDYIAAPGDAEVRLASGRRSFSASPTALTASSDGDDGFVVSSTGGFRGLGAVLVEVTTATDASGNEDATTTGDGATVLLSIPVQVGDDKPTLECPTTVLPISAGQEIDLDLASFCKVVTLDPRDAADLDYEAEWSAAVDGLEAGPVTGSIVPVTAAETATEGGEATLSVRAGDSNAQEVRFRLAQAPRPTLLPIKVESMEAGQSRTYDLASYLEAGVADPSPTIVSVETTGNPDVRATTEGSKLTLTAAKDSRGTQAGFRLVVSDIDATDPPPSRRAEGRIQFQVVGTPGAPSAPRPYPVSEDEGTITMSWRPPADDGGAPILFYRVREERTGEEQKCDSTECDFGNLEGGNYSFRVQAVNRVGEGEWSELSRQARVDTAPGRVRNIRMRERGDGTITIAWDKPTTTSRILNYSVQWVGGQVDTIPGDQTSFTAAGLNNNEKYVFSVRGENRADWSLPRASAELQPLGTPPSPPAPTVTDLEDGVNQTSVRIIWQAVLPEGPGPTLYTVSYDNGQSSGAVPGCQKIATLSCTHAGLPYDGLTYTYRVVAANQPSDEPGNRSAPSEGTSLALVGRPAQWGDWSWTATGRNQEIRLTYTVPDSRGAESNVEVLVGGLVNRTFPNQYGTNTVTVTTPSNDQAYPIELRVCNEKAPAGCTLSGAKPAQSYGPLGQEHVGDPTVTGTSGTTIDFVVTARGNGRPALLEVTVSGPGGTLLSQTRAVPAGSVTEGFTVDAGDYDTQVTITARISDAGRGSGESSVQVRSGPPPPPQVLVGRGAACLDGDADTSNDCQRGIGDIWGPCTDASCSKLVIHPIDWRNINKVTCRIIDAQQPRFLFAGESESVDTGQPTTVSWFSNGAAIRISCEGGGQSATGLVAW